MPRIPLPGAESPATNAAEIADHIAREIGPIIRLADARGHSMLAYLLGLALDEANTQAAAVPKARQAPDA